MVIALNASGGDPVSRLYAFLVVLELAIDLPVRVLHSGIYATRRVYKPVWAIFVPTLAQLAILGVGFYLYPTAAIITAIVVSNALSIWITVHFCLEIYRLMGLRRDTAATITGSGATFRRFRSGPGSRRHCPG